MRFVLCCLLLSLSPAGLAGQPAESLVAAPVKTEIVERDGRFIFLRDGEPYTVKGAGIEFADPATLAARGGNSFRNWSTEDAQRILDRAHELGLTVALCLGIGRERQGFDYDDPQAVADQLAAAREEVLKYRDHPALLAWIIGNELNLEAENPKVYDAVNDVAKMIHELDPNHPTTTTLAGFGEDLAALVNERAPDLDFISIQLYGDLVTLPKYLRQTKFARPYVVSEWGAVGHWEMPSTYWGAPVEQTSSEKARTYKMMYDKAIAYDSPYNLGSFVFFWGQKQERTPTWYGLFLSTGESTEAVDVMYRIWNGRWPDNRAPQVKSIRLNNRLATNNPELRSGKQYTARVKVVDPDRDPLDYHWEVRYESRSQNSGGDAERVPPLAGGVAVSHDGAKATLQASQPGAYRLFMFAYDGQGHTAHANIPFLVRN